METLDFIELACKDRNHDEIRKYLDAIDSSELKKDAFLRIINYYENTEGNFPVGYAMLYLDWTLKNGDYSTGGRYISKLCKLGVSEGRIANLVYENIIKPQELFYEERFNSNLDLIKSNNVLISDQDFNFHDIKKQITIINNEHDSEIDFQDTLNIEKSCFLLYDVIDMRLINHLLELNNLLYLAFDDLHNFYYLLLFEDFSMIQKHIEAMPLDKEENVIFLPGSSKERLHDMFMRKKMMPIPAYDLSALNQDVYFGFIQELEVERNKIADANVKEAMEYYKNLDHQYYRSIFNGKPSDIRIAVITNLRTSLNQHISRSWYNSFASLGYAVKLFIEDEKYEVMCGHYIYEQLNEFKPDIVFIINFSVHIISEVNDINDHLLWIMRHRDYCAMNFGDYKYTNENMFVVPVFRNYVEDLKAAFMPEDRICYTPEGIDINVFNKRATINKKYEADIVIVNNAVGNEHLRLEYYLAKINDAGIKNILSKLFELMQKMSLNEEFLSEKGFVEISRELFDKAGIVMTDFLKMFFRWFYLAVMNSLYRKAVFQWIIDSKITDNIKVWGSSWSQIDAFKKYHMGNAQYGLQLSEIYQSSKISISDSWEWNTHERNFEIMTSGGFPLTRYIDDDDNKVDVITNYLKEGEEIVLFYEKDDLLNKIQYYLDNPAERERITENGRKAALEKFSSLAITGKTMNFIKDYFR